jgi:hypothetical protein
LHYYYHRQESESKALQNKVQTLFELRFAKEQEIARQQKETKQMEFEDVNIYRIFLIVITIIFDIIAYSL